MRTKKPSGKSGLISCAGVVRLLTHALMGAAMGLALALTVIRINPAIAMLLDHGGNSAALVFAGIVVTTFTIGAALTGAVFILTEDREY